MRTVQYYNNQTTEQRRLNLWDIIVLLFVLTLFFGLGWSASQMAAPYHLGQVLPISLDPHYLPRYAMLTVMRMFIALFFSLLFTFIFGTWAAKSRRAEQWIIPSIDILQSIPVLSFLSVTVVGFIHLFPGSLLGPECACIFAIFTAQVWNMALGFYQSLKMLPKDLVETARVFHLSAWQKFWRIEVPFSLSGLLWNIMISISASWFFVVLSEAISVSNQSIRLPGVGSYIAVAIQQSNKWAVFYAVLTMLIVILLYDQLLFRPLMTWSERFKSDSTESGYSSWLFNLLNKTRFLRHVTDFFAVLVDFFVNVKPLARLHQKQEASVQQRERRQIQFWSIIEKISIACLIGIAILFVNQFFWKMVSLSEVLHVFYLGSLTALRIIVLIFLSSLVWIPIGVWIGTRPRWTLRIQPIIQFCAAFPANLVYPVVVVTIVLLKLNVNIWLSPLMILGTQWYILFNVIAGASQIPQDLWQAAENFNVKGLLWWRRLGFPSIFPYYITGAITAAGGAWNASIVAEWVSWGNTTLVATGLGSYIHQYTQSGDFTRVALGTAVMCLFVLAFSCFFWRPLYHVALDRFKMDVKAN